MKRILLTQGLYTLVDDEDYDELNKYKWSADRRKNQVYAVRFKGTYPLQKKIYMHAQVLPTIDEQYPNQYPDHKNGDGLDNRKENLRRATKIQNGQNRGVTARNTTGTKGVFWDKSRGKWAARIVVNKKEISLGRFGNLQNAINARTQAEQRYFGEFAHSSLK